MSRWHRRRHKRARKWRPEKHPRQPPNVAALWDIMRPAFDVFRRMAEAWYSVTYRPAARAQVPAIKWTNPAVRDMLEEEQKP